MNGLRNLVINTSYGNFELKEILDKIIHDLVNRYNDIIKKIILFGSYAREDFNENSDIDIFILIKDVEWCNSEIYELEMDLLFEYGIQIEIFVEKISDYRHKTNYFLIKNIEKDGIELWKSE